MKLDRFSGLAALVRLVFPTSAAAAHKWNDDEVVRNFVSAREKVAARLTKPEFQTPVDRKPGSRIIRLVNAAGRTSFFKGLVSL